MWGSKLRYVVLIRDVVKWSSDATVPTHFAPAIRRRTFTISKLAPQKRSKIEFTAANDIKLRQANGVLAPAEYDDHL